MAHGGKLTTVRALTQLPKLGADHLAVLVQLIAFVVGAALQSLRTTFIILTAGAVGCVIVSRSGSALQISSTGAPAAGSGPPPPHAPALPSRLR